MMKDPTEFRDRFARWKVGEKVYENGLPTYGGGKSTKKGSYCLPGEKIRRELDVPYDNSSYDYRRANQLGYEPDETGQLPSRDWITGRYLKTPTHPTESLSIYTDLGLGYDVFDKYGNTYSQPNWGSTWLNRLPRYGDGKGDIDFHDDVTKHIIRKEGVLAAPKDIGDGKITIGSGLTQQKYIDQYKRNGNKWSQKENYIAVKDTVRGFENSLRGILPEYDQYPAEMRKALIDIIYNIGEGGLKNSPKFLSAMKLHNWKEAKRLMDWDNSDPLFGNDARKRNAERAALFDAGLAHWSPTGPVELMMKNKPVFVPQPVFVPLTRNNTDYSIETMTSPTIPLMLNSRNSGDSPLYGGNDYSFRMPSLKEYIERNLMRPQW